MTGQLLAFARHQPLKPEVFDVCDRIEGVAELARSLVGPQISISVEHQSQGGCPTLADTNQLDAALLNWASDARDAMAGVGPSGCPPSGTTPRAGGGSSRSTFSTQVRASTRKHCRRSSRPRKSARERASVSSQVFGVAKQSGGDVDVCSRAEGAVFTL